MPVEGGLRCIGLTRDFASRTPSETLFPSQKGQNHQKSYCPCMAWTIIIV